jgi:hypothetical protein
MVKGGSNERRIKDIAERIEVELEKQPWFVGPTDRASDDIVWRRVVTSRPEMVSVFDCTQIIVLRGGKQGGCDCNRVQQPCVPTSVDTHKRRCAY